VKIVVGGAGQPLGDGVAAGLAAGGHDVVRWPGMHELAGGVPALDAPLDGLVLSGWAAAALDPCPFEAIDDERFGAAWEAPMRGTVAALQAAYPWLVAARGAVVVLVPTTSMTGGANYAPGAAVFEAQRILVKSAARQWGPAGVRVNAVAVDPQLVLHDPLAAGPVSIAPVALGDPGDPAADVAPVVAFLLSGAAHHLTGVTLSVDGGLWMGGV
jgi:3-oxoacyl-[acyl-carrier protein] reductase